MSIVEFPNVKNENVKNRDKPADILEFSPGCKDCIHLVQVDEGTYICAERVHVNDTPIVPVVQDERTGDWGCCGGIDYERQYRKASNQNRRGR